MRKATDKGIGYLRSAIVAVTTAGLVGLGVVIGYANRPFEGGSCAVRNSTSDDATGRIMRCNPTPDGSHDVVWRYPPAS